MADYCATCGSEITFGGMIKKENQRLAKRQTDLVNFRNETSHAELCQTCGGSDYQEIVNAIKDEISKLERNIAQNIPAFPIFTCERLPEGVDVKYVGLVTANASVGTGIFNEFSQGFSDFFGVTNTTTGMAHKVNTGEQAVRSMLAKKAITLGANCVLGVDIDYGATANNAATVNMQGTAALILQLEVVLTPAAYAAAIALKDDFDRMGEHQGWLAGKFPSRDLD